MSVFYYELGHKIYWTKSQKSFKKDYAYSIMYLNVYKATMGIIFALINHTINIYIINCNHSNRLDLLFVEINLSWTPPSQSPTH